MVRLALLVFFRLVTRVFFRRVQVTGIGHVPAGAVMLVGNHPNSLLDPILIATTAPRPLRFAAKDTLFSVPVMGALIKAAGGVPIRRPQDHGAAGLNNDQAFAALTEVLAAGGMFGIFPEGLSHDGPELAPLKTGAARIALEARAAGIAVAIVPVGLTYSSRDRMRSRVLVHYGEPLPAPPGGEGTDAVRALTAAIDDALRDVTINAPDWETARAVDVLRAVAESGEGEGDGAADGGEDLHQRAVRVRSLLDALESGRENPLIQALLARANAYASALDGLDIEDADLRGGLSRRTWAVRLLRHAALLLLWLPLALPGIALHAPALVAAVVLGRGLSPRSDVLATTKMMLVTLLVLLSYGVVGLVVLFGLPFPLGLWAAVWGVAALMLSGWATIRVLERQAVLRRGLGVFVHLLRWRRWLLFLQEERAALRQEARKVACQSAGPT